MRFSERRHMVARALTCWITIVVSASCNSAPATPSADTTTFPRPRETATAELDDSLRNAIRVRTTYGLRADEAWVRSVAADPTALVPAEWDIPLLPGELADLMSRRWPHELLLQVRRYGQQFPDDFSTAYHNLEASGVVIAFKANVDIHRAALQQFPLAGPVEVRMMEWSYKDLESFVQRVKSEEAWLTSVGAGFIAPTIRSRENRVLLRYEGRPDLEEAIASHFGNPTWLRVRWDGPFRGKPPSGI